MGPRRPHLLFDVMSTLVHDPIHDAIPGFFDLELGELFEQVRRGNWVAFERAEIDEATFLGRFFADGRDYDHQGFLEAVRGGYRWLPGMEALVAELAAADWSLHTLSNYPIWYQMIEEELALSRYLDWTFVSWKTGLRKPDPAVYRQAAAALGCETTDCLFIDDRHVNCEAARQEGMDAICFDGAARLREALGERGIL